MANHIFKSRVFSQSCARCGGEYEEPQHDNLRDLRDDFAIAALEGLFTWWADFPREQKDARSFGTDAYRIADAMLAARAKEAS